MKWSWKSVVLLASTCTSIQRSFCSWGSLVVTHWMAERSLAGTLEGIGFMLVLFGCVLLHEFGHALDGPPLRHPNEATSRCCPSAAWPGWSACLRTRGRSSGWRWPGRRSTWSSPPCPVRLAGRDRHLLGPLASLSVTRRFVPRAADGGQRRRWCCSTCCPRSRWTAGA